MTHTTRLPPAVVLLLGAALAAACAQGASPSSPTSQFPAALPQPGDSVVIVGAGGAGFDAGTRLYGFSSDLAPAAALRGYAAQLKSGGFVARGSDGLWDLYGNGSLVVAVRVGASGPPTDLFVRVFDPGIAPLPASFPASSPGRTASTDSAAAQAVPHPDPPHGTPATASEPGNGNGNGKPQP